MKIMRDDDERFAVYQVDFGHKEDELGSTKEIEFDHWVKEEKPNALRSAARFFGFAAIALILLLVIHGLSGCSQAHQVCNEQRARVAEIEACRRDSRCLITSGDIHEARVLNERIAVSCTAKGK